MTRVLDHGFINLIDRMGDDSAIVQAARVSTGSEGRTAEADRKLIAFLLKNGHASPFEHVTLKFHVKCPIFVAREWQRHRTQSYNEASSRYKVLPSEAYVPDWARIGGQPKRGDNQQGTAYGDDLAPMRNLALANIENAYTIAFGMYEAMIAAGVAREIARLVLPVATYTEMYVTVNLWNAFHFLKLRCDPAAQWEIREYAWAMFDLIAPVVPVALASAIEFGIVPPRI